MNIKTMPRQKQQGFTLLEISIVIVAVGLVISGIIVGSNLIKSAALRALSAQPAELIAAIHTFEQKYDCLPGDCKQAEDLGFTTPITVNNVNAPYGNGDGRIVFYQTQIRHGGNDSKSFAESYMAPTQLQQAGLISGTGPAPYGPYTLDFPMLKTNGKTSLSGAWLVSYIPAGEHNGQTTSVPEDGHYLYVRGIEDMNDLGKGYTHVLTPADAYDVDQKLDDGLPRTGKILGTGGIFTQFSEGTSSIVAPTFAADSDTGVAGPLSHYCVTNDSPNQYNVLNDSLETQSLCVITVEADF